MPLFGNPAVAEEARRNVGRCPGPYNRVMGWFAPPVVVAVGGPPG